VIGRWARHWHYVSLGARHADGRPVGGRGNPAVFGFYANKQMTTGEGGMIARGEDPAMKARIDSERNQGLAPDMGWLAHDRLGFNYPPLGDRLCSWRGAAGAP
jgi:perosamine synthetase